MKSFILLVFAFSFRSFADSIEHLEAQCENYNQISSVAAQNECISSDPIPGEKLSDDYGIQAAVSQWAWAGEQLESEAAMLELEIDEQNAKSAYLRDNNTPASQFFTEKLLEDFSTYSQNAKMIMEIDAKLDDCDTTNAMKRRTSRSIRYCATDQKKKLEQELLALTTTKSLILMENPVFASEGLSNLVESSSRNLPTSLDKFSRVYQEEAENYIKILEEEKAKLDSFISTSEYIQGEDNSKLNGHAQSSRVKQRKAMNLKIKQDQYVLSKVLSSTDLAQHEGSEDEICSLLENYNTKLTQENIQNGAVTAASMIIPMFMGPLGVGIRAMFAARGISATSHLAKIGISARTANLTMDGALGMASNAGFSLSEISEAEKECNAKLIGLKDADDKEALYDEIKQCKSDVSTQKAMLLLDAAPGAVLANLHKLPKSVLNKMSPEKLGDFLAKNASALNESIKASSIGPLYSSMSESGQKAAQELYAKMEKLFGKAKGKAKADEATKSCLLK